MRVVHMGRCVTATSQKGIPGVLLVYHPKPGCRPYMLLKSPVQMVGFVLISLGDLAKRSAKCMTETNGYRVLRSLRWGITFHSVGFLERCEMDVATIRSSGMY